MLAIEGNLCVSVVDLSEHLGIADSLYNLQLVEDCCQKLSLSVFHVTLVDLLYCTTELRLNISTLLADIFHQVEANQGLFILNASVDLLN